MLVLNINCVRVPSIGSLLSRRVTLPRCIMRLGRSGSSTPSFWTKPILGPMMRPPASTGRMTPGAVSEALGERGLREALWMGPPAWALQLHSAVASWPLLGLGAACTIGTGWVTGRVFVALKYVLWPSLLPLHRPFTCWSRKQGMLRLARVASGRREEGRQGRGCSGVSSCAWRLHGSL